MAKDISFDQAKELAWGLTNPKDEHEEIVKFYADMKDFELDEASFELSIDVLKYTQIHLSKLYTDTENDSKLVVRSNEDDLLSNFNKVCVNFKRAKFMLISNKGETFNIIFKDVKVTSDNQEIVGTYRQVGTHEDAPLYKRLTSPTTVGYGKFGV